MQSTLHRDRRDAWRWSAIGGLCFWCGVIAIAILVLFGCAAPASGHARAGGSEIGSTIVNPTKVTVKADIYGQLTPDTIDALRGMIQNSAPEAK